MCRKSLPPCRRSSGCGPGWTLPHRDLATGAGLLGCGAKRPATGLLHRRAGDPITVAEGTPSWRARPATSSSNASRLGASRAFTAIRATASTACWARSGARDRRRVRTATRAPASSSSRSGMRRWPRSWPPRTPSSPASSGFASRPAGRARRISSPGSTMPSQTMSPCSRSAARRRRRCAARATSRSSTSTACSPTSPIMCRKRTRPPRSGT